MASQNSLFCAPGTPNTQGTPFVQQRGDRRLGPGEPPSLDAPARASAGASAGGRSCPRRATGGRPRCRRDGTEDCGIRLASIQIKVHGRPPGDERIDRAPRPAIDPLLDRAPNAAEDHPPRRPGRRCVASSPLQAAHPPESPRGKAVISALRPVAEMLDALQDDRASVVDRVEGLDPRAPVDRARAPGGRCTSCLPSLSWTCVVLQSSFRRRGSLRGTEFEILAWPVSRARPTSGRSIVSTTSRRSSIRLPGWTPGGMFSTQIVTPEPAESSARVVSPRASASRPLLGASSSPGSESPPGWTTRQLPAGHLAASRRSGGGRRRSPPRCGRRDGRGRPAGPG